MHILRLTSTGAALCLLLPTIAMAQPGQSRQAPPPPPSGSYDGGYGYGQGSYAQPPTTSPFYYRSGLTLGFGVGVGSMTADSGPIDCFQCDYSPLSGGVDFHIGGMLNPRLALLFEGWLTVQTLDADGTEALVQTMGLIAAQYWLTPRLWIKGGIGAASLSVSVDDGFRQDSAEIDTGTAVMGAIGYEVANSSRFAVDMQLRLGSGNYDGIGDRIHAVALGLGVNWY